MVVITAFDDHVWGGFLTKIYHFLRSKSLFTLEVTPFKIMTLRIARILSTKIKVNF